MDDPLSELWPGRLDQAEPAVAAEPADCEHVDLFVAPKVSNLTGRVLIGGRETIVGRVLELRVTCRACSTPMRMLGIPVAAPELGRAAVNHAQTTLWVPMAPADPSTVG